jgi:colanic acid biosynthesis glycosyl transferase WcaI
VHLARILIHTLVFAPDGVSTAHLMSDLAVELRRNGHDVTVLTSTPHYNPDPVAAARQPIRPVWGKLLGKSDYQGVPVYHALVGKKGTKRWLRGLDYIQFHVLSLFASAFAVPKVDVIIAPSPPLSMGVMSWLYGAVYGVPSVYNVQEIYPDCLLNHALMDRGWVYRAMQRLESFVYKRNRFLVAISDEFAATLRTRGVDDHRLATIPNFVNTEIFKPLPRDNAFAARHGLLDRFTVLYCGNVGLGQDWDAVLAAAERLRDDPVLFVVVGDGARRPWLEEEAKRRGLPNVRLLGHQPREYMPEIYASSDVQIIPLEPGTAFDVFPSKIYTIMACGKPVIVSAESDSGIALLVDRAACGEVIPTRDPARLADAIRRAAANREELARAGVRGRDFAVRHYSQTSAGEAYGDLIEHLLKPNAHAQPQSAAART